MTPNTQDNPNWTLNIPPLAGVTPFDPTRVRPDTGAYPAIITASHEHTKVPEGTKSVKFTTEITDGKFKGAQVDIYMGFEKINESGSFNQKAWTTLLISTGVPIQVLTQPNQLGPSTFQGKRVYIYVKNAPEGEKGGKDNRNFMTMEQYTAQVAAQQQQQAAQGNGAAPKLGAPVGAPSAFGVPQPQGTLASPGGALAGAGLPVVQNGMTQLVTGQVAQMPAQMPQAPGVLPGAAPAPAGGVVW